jgi:hypothetical protein
MHTASELRFLNVRKVMPDGGSWDWNLVTLAEKY